MLPEPVPSSTTTPVETWPAPQAPTPIPTATARGEPVFYPASDPALRYTGRFDFTDPQRPAFDWSGTSIEVQFTGPELALLLDDGSNYYDVTIDGKSSVLQTVPGQKVYQIAADLVDELHTLQIRKRTEAYVGAAVFEGLLLGSGQRLLPPPPPPAHRLEFIGDSITAGYGIEGDAPECYFTPATQNANRSFAAQTAAALGAEYALVALSGLGVVRNLRDPQVASPETAVAYIDRVLGMNPILHAEPSSWVPDAVIVNLGTNDFSSPPFPEDEAFMVAYQELLSAIRARYAEAHIVALGGPLMLGRGPQLINQAVMRQQQATGDARVHFLLIEDDLERSAEDFGCDWHPNVHGHGKIAAQLQPALQTILGW